MNRSRAAAFAVTVLTLTACSGPPQLTSVSASGVPSPSSGASAVTSYLRVAHTVFPGAGVDALVATAHGICTDLRTDLSVHDEVGAVAARTGSQPAADELVRAAMAAYCPDIAARPSGSATGTSAAAG